MPLDKLTLDDMDTFIQWREDIGFDTTNSNWINSRNVLNMTPLQVAVLTCEQGDLRAPMILHALLELGADPTMNVAHNEGAEEEQRDCTSGNAIAFAAARGVIHACAIMYKHNPAIVDAPTGKDDMLNAFTAAAFQLDNEDTSVWEAQRKAACEQLIRLFVKEMHYDVNTPLATGDIPLECMVLNNRPIATKLLIELGGDIGAGKDMNILQLAACAGSNHVVLVIKEFCPGLFDIPEDLNIRPLILAMINRQKMDNAPQYKDTIQFFAQEQYSDGIGVIEILSTAVHKNLLLSINELVDIWVTKFDPLANATPLMWAMENIKSPICRDLVSYISKLPQEIQDQMPEFGNGFLSLDDDNINVHYPQFALDTNPRCPGGIGKKVLVVLQHQKADHMVPTGITHANAARWVVHVDRDAFNYACAIHPDKSVAQIISEKPNLGTFNDNTRSDHIHWAAQFANHQTVHNIAERERQTINNFNSFLKNPLMYAVNRWVQAQEEVSKAEAKYVIAEIVVHGGSVEDLRIFTADDGYDIVEDVQNIIDHAWEILADFPGHAALGGDDGFGLSALDLAA